MILDYKSLDTITLLVRLTSWCLPCFIKSLPTKYSAIALHIQAINLVISITIRVPGLLSSKCPAVFSYTNITMFQCTNQPRGCRGRCNTLGGKCKDCSSLRLKHGHRPVQYQSKLAQPVNYQRSLASIYSDDTRQPQQTWRLGNIIELEAKIMRSTFQRRCSGSLLNLGSGSMALHTVRREVWCNVQRTRNGLWRRVAFFVLHNLAFDIAHYLIQRIRHYSINNSQGAKKLRKLQLKYVGSRCDSGSLKYQVGWRYRTRKYNCRRRM